MFVIRAALKEWSQLGQGKQYVRFVDTHSVSNQWNQCLYLEAKETDFLRFLNMRMQQSLPSSVRRADSRHGIERQFTSNVAWAAPCGVPHMSLLYLDGGVFGDELTPEIAKEDKCRRIVENAYAEEFLRYYVCSYPVCPSFVIVEPTKKKSSPSQCCAKLFQILVEVPLCPPSRGSSCGPTSAAA